MDLDLKYPDVLLLMDELERHQADGGLSHTRVIGLQTGGGTVKGAPTNHIHSEENKQAHVMTGAKEGLSTFINTAQLDSAAHTGSCPALTLYLCQGETSRLHTVWKLEAGQCSQR